MGRKTFILEETGVRSGASQSQRYWSCLENNSVGDRAAHWEEGPESQALGAALPPFDRRRGRGEGGLSLAEAQPAHRGSSCPIPPYPSVCPLLLVETRPPACGACCWGQ